LAAVPSIGRADRTAAPEADLTRALYERYAAQIFRYCLHQLGSREEAEDAVQSTFLNAFRGIKRGVVPELEAAWLFKIAHNVCLSRRRSSWRRTRIESPTDFELVEEVAPAPSRLSDELVGLQDVLEQMPENQRRAILLREWQGLSYREIAEELEVSQPAVETLIFRARRSLAKGLEEPPAPAGKRRALRGADLGNLLTALKSLLLGGGGGAAAAKVAAVVAVVGAGSVVASSPVVHHRAHRPALVTATQTPSKTVRATPASPPVVSTPAVAARRVRPAAARHVVDAIAPAAAVSGTQPPTLAGDATDTPAPDPAQAAPAEVAAAAPVSAAPQLAPAAPAAPTTAAPPTSHAASSVTTTAPTGGASTSTSASAPPPPPPADTTTTASTSTGTSDPTSTQPPPATTTTTTTTTNPPPPPSSSPQGSGGADHGHDGSGDGDGNDNGHGQGGGDHGSGGGSHGHGH
jgi:RNA polymerase sigma factor (sigma-70 family)